MMENKLKEFLRHRRDNIYYYVPSNCFWSQGIRKNYNSLMKSQWWDYDDLENLQMRKLSKLLNFVFKYVPFYQRVFNELNIVPEDIRTIDDLKQFPIIDKTFVNNNYDDFIPRFEFDNLQRARTSGSSGQTLEFKWHPNYFNIKIAANYRHQNWSGRKWTDKTINFGMPLYNSKKNVFFQIDYKRKVWQFNTEDLSCENINKMVDVINEIQPDCIGGFPAILQLIATNLKEKNRKFVKYPRSIITVGEIISDVARKNIEEMFQAKIYDWYGLMEGCAAAGQCEYGNYHMNMEYCLVEFVEQDGIKRIVGTNLENFAFPLIRYDTGDTGEFVGFHCDCKRGLSIMKPTEGRITDFIKTSNGNKNFYYNYFSKILNMPIKECQIVQNKIDSIDLFLVKGNNFKEENMKKIRHHLKEILGQDMIINIHYVGNIKRGPGGKFRFIVSNL